MSKKRTIIYIDGYNLYYGLLKGVRFYFVEEMGNVGEAASRRFRRNEHVRFPNRENSGNTLEND